MHKCFDLSRLPKVPGFRSINRRNVTPGSPLPSLFPGMAPYDPARTVDPTHPATRWKARAFPNFSCSAFMLRAVPKGALLRPEFESPVSQAERSTMVPCGNRKNSRRRLDMSILFMISKKKTNKRAVVRNRIAMRIRAAFELIVVRGADAEPRENVQGGDGGKESRPEESASSTVARKPNKNNDRSVHKARLANMVFSATPPNLGLVSNPAPTKHLILQDWTYVMSPSLLSYRMPLPDLIQHLRTGLESIRAQSMKLDALWALDKRTANLPLAPITSEEPEENWRQIATDEDELPALFDLDAPEQAFNKKERSINTQKQPIKLFFPTLPPSGESLSALFADGQPVTSPTCTTRRLTPLANGPSHRSPDSISDPSKVLRPHRPAQSIFKTGAMDRLATVKNRPLVVLGRKSEPRHV
ncbi:uncharacterized protein EDB91DRAFT_773050 [Suillus paluster]|uniref:uncharacterized protein n=1 Tax=Suillus paluster TaxID=48578 RepID=UPI001B85BCAA|nr:uncharacterized protein EDB91DRAFT_773050 [Suillus paluster]KAG1749907.1 hypothetical protein EDB91DRAFT_773050 [Suillus paluster]